MNPKTRQSGVRSANAMILPNAGGTVANMSLLAASSVVRETRRSRNRRRRRQQHTFRQQLPDQPSPARTQ